MRLKIRVGLLLVLSVLGYGQFEVIKLSEGLSKKTASRLWPVFNNGGVTVNKQEIIIPDGTSLFIQSRTTPNEYTAIDLKRHKEDWFTAYEATANSEMFAYAVIAGDGHYYLFERKRATGEIQGPEMRHGISTDRMFLISNNRLLVTSIHRPELKDYVKKYRTGPISEQRRNNKEKFDPLFKNHKAYTLSIYDKDLQEIQTGNVIERVGDNARAFEGTYLIHAVDTAAGGVLYLIDNDQGYFVEKYNDFVHYESGFEIKNRDFIALEKDLSLNDLELIRATRNSYSVPYALYYKSGLLLTCFFQAPKRVDDVVPPYHYDISTKEGDLLYSGKMVYPFLCEDDGDIVFLYVKIEGGWFEDDEHYLVGVTLEDILNGRVNKVTIDKQVDEFRKM